MTTTKKGLDSARVEGFHFACEGELKYDFFAHFNRVISAIASIDKENIIPNFFKTFDRVIPVRCNRRLPLTNK